VIAQIFKSKNKKGESLIYKGHKVVPYCYRCGTTLSSHEVAQGYQTVKDNSVYVKFKAKPNLEKGIDDKTYFLAWTTTPWTLPGNVALAINPQIRYSFIGVAGEIYIIATELLNKLVEKSFFVGETVVVKEVFGSDLVGLEYESLYKVENPENKKAHYVAAGDFVSISDGTGIVHIAPAFGEDDANVGRENNLPTLLTVDEAGRVNVAVPGQGIPVKKKNEKNKYAVDELILEDLKARGLLFGEELYEHEYPFCWRCDTPLIYYAKPSWFIRMSELSEDLVENNEKINWIPEYIKEGRFGEWLRGVKDWAISRERYWGTPLPLWECVDCKEVKAIESIAEMEKLSGQKLEDLHKPYIDDVRFGCSCGGEMKRVPEVLDVWFDSGSMPLAQFLYPNAATKEDKEKIEGGKYFPADYISEAIDQTRGWFYTLHAIATLLNREKKVPTGYAFKNVICLAHILDKDGKKMSKSRGNVVEPMEVMDKFGADMLRWMLFTVNQPGAPKRFDIKGMQDIMNRVFRMLWNSYSFFTMYAIIDKWEVKDKWQSENLLDKWVMSELHVLIGNTDSLLEKYDIYAAAGEIEKFIDNLSNWYIRRSRKRFWKSEDDADKESAYQTLHTVLVELSRLMAPFTPFIAEEIYKNLTGEESVHLADFPVVNLELIDQGLNEEMQSARNIITEALQLRAKAGIKVRQPLAELQVMGYKLRDEFLEIIKDELNIKAVVIKESVEKKISLDLEITEELKMEGQAREIIRSIQEMRKEAGYEIDNRIEVGYVGMEGVFNNFGSLIAKEVLATELKTGILDNFDLEKEINIEDAGIKIYLKR
jgi:isoleucyl-tRNA synthetase